MISKTYLENGTTDAVYQNETTIGVVDKRYNGAMIPIFNNTVALGANNKLVLKVNISNLDLFSRLNSIKLSILPNIMRYDKPIKLSLETDFSSNTGEYIEDFVAGELDRYEVDITKYVVGKEDETFYFGISSESSYPIAIQSYDSPYVTVNYLEYANSIKNQLLVEGSVGRKINYGVDIRNGALLVSKNLYQFTGCLMPMSLNLIYNSVNGDSVVEEGLPLGWKLNYFQKVTFESGTATYLDANGVSHKFSVTGDLNKFHSINGTGMILTKSSDGSSMIFDGNNGYLLFNPDGYLITIRKRIGNSNLDTILEYNTSNQLVKITDPMGNIVNIAYSDSQIQISKFGYPTINLYRDQNRILYLTECGNRRVDFTYAKPNSSVNVYYLYTILNDNGEQVKFRLNKSFKVVEISDVILKNGVPSTIENKLLEYVWNFTKVTNYHNVERIYTFNEKGEIKSIYKNDNDYITSTGQGDEEMQKEYIISNSQSKYVLNSKVINDFHGYIENSTDTLTTSVDNMSFEEGKTYNFSFSYTMQEGSEHREGEYVKFLIIQGDVTLFEKELTPNNKGISVSNTFKCISNGTPEFKLAFYKTRSGVGISDIIVSRCNKLERNVCFNVENEEVEPIALDTENFYPRTQPFIKIQYTHESGVTIEANVKMYEEDMRENIKNCVLANGGTFDLWCNRVKELIPNVKDVVVFVDDNTGISLSNFIMCIYTKSETKEEFIYDDYSNCSPVTNILKTQYKTTIFENIFYDECKIVNKDYLVVENENYDGIKYNYLYNTYGNLLKETVSAYGTNLTMVKECEYSSDSKRLLKEKTLSTNLETAEVEYSYNDKGLLDKVIMPNGLEYNYSYDTNSLELIQISCNDSSIVTENHISYLKDLVSNMSHKGNIGYDFSYDKYNSISAVKTNYNGTLKDFINMTRSVTTENDEYMIQYPTGYREKVLIDEFGNVIKRLSSTEGLTFAADKEYYYSSHKIQNVDNVTDPESEELNKTESSKLVKTIDKIANDIMRVEYNSDELVKKVTHTNSRYASESTYDYDVLNRMTESIYKDLDTMVTTNYQYRDNNYSPTSDVESINVVVTDLNNSYIGNFNHTNYVDQFKRVSREVKRVETIDLDQTYSYGSIDNKTTLIPASISYIKSVSGIRDFESFGTINYTYDKMNNITGIVDGFTTNNISYSYDLFGRLVSEQNSKLEKNYIYSYDDKGNIISKTVTSNGTTTNYNYTYSATYPDRLTAYNGQTIGYDLNGNITQIGSKTLTWTKGKQLKTFKSAALSTFTYTYDADGRRLSKTGPLNQYSNYTYDGDKLVGEVSYVKLGGTRKLKYIYSGNEILGFILNDVSYLFIKNLQHDIIGIVNTNGEIVAKYVYDAWGNHTVYDGNDSPNTTASFIGNINPFRYRGYYYDTESGLYWCKSRYYNPEWGRWLSLDSTEYLDFSSINGLNLYAYCVNNPVNMYDPSGRSFESFFQSLSKLFSKEMGFTHKCENNIIEGYYFWYEYQSGTGRSKSINKGINFLVITPENPLDIFGYSFGLEFFDGRFGGEIYFGTEIGIGVFNNNGGVNISFNASGRLKYTISNNILSPDNYIFTSFVVNTHNIFGTIVILYFAPVLIPYIGNAAVEFLKYITEFKVPSFENPIPDFMFG